MSDKQPSAERELITKEVFEHLVDLAAFELDSEEAAYLRRELNQQLDAIRELDAIEVDGATPITSHGVPYTSTTSMPLRPDEARKSDKADDILTQAPEVRHRYVVVPDIPHEALG